MEIQALFLFLSILGILQGFTIACIILLKSKKQSVLQQLLAAIFTVGAFAMLMVTLVNSGWLEENALSQGFEYLLGLLIGPLIYMYCHLHLFNREFRLKKYYLHFLPAIGYLFWLLLENFFQFEVRLPILLIMLHFQAYTFASGYWYLQIRKLKKNNLNSEGRNWIPLILSFLIVVALGQWLRFILSDVQIFELIVPSMGALSFHLTTLIGFHRSNLLRDSKGKRTKYLTSNALDVSKAHELEGIMQIDALYCITDLSLSKLALKLEMHPNQLSHLINQFFNCSFKDYVNSYRIEHAKKLLKSQAWEHLTIEAIAEEAGFKSRSVFYRVFKEKVGMTPVSFKQAGKGEK